MSIWLEGLRKTFSPIVYDFLADDQKIVNLLSVSVKGAYDMELVYALEQGTENWASHPKIGELVASLTPKGQDWARGLLSLPESGIGRVADTTLIGTLTFNQTAENSGRSDWSNASYRAAVLSASGFDIKATGKNLIASINANKAVYLTTHGSFDPQLDASGKTADDAVRAFLRVCGYNVLADVPSRVKRRMTGNYPKSVLDPIPHSSFGGFPWNVWSGGYALATWVRVDDIVRCGVDYAVVFYNTLNNGLTSNEGSFALYVPIQKANRATVPVMNITMGTVDSITGEEWGAVAHPLTAAATYPWGEFNLTAYFDVPVAYRTSLFGTTFSPADVTAYSGFVTRNPLSTGLKAELAAMGITRMLQLVGPPGEAFYAVKVAGTPEVTTTTTEVTVDDVVYTVVEQFVEVTASEVLSAVPQAWYEEYYASGFGFFAGKGAEAAAAKAAKMPALAGLTHTAVFYDTAIAVPTDLVTRLTTYAQYKKAREKACLSNDFMEQSYDGKMTWGQANSLCNKSSSVRTVYGYRDRLPSVSLPAPSMSGISFTISTSATPWTVTRFENGVASAVAYQDGEALSEMMAGAALTGGTLAGLLTNWGLSSTEMTAASAEVTAESTTWSSNLNASYRGTKFATHDFAWESAGISGFPTVRDMTAQDGLKALLISIATVQLRTEPLHRAYLQYGKRSVINATLAA